MSGVIVGLIACFICVVMCGSLAWRSFRRLGRHTRTHATIARYFLDHGDGTTYHPVLRFETAGGDRTTAISPYGSSSKDWPIGSVVRITYAPDKPRRAEIISFGALWLGPIAFAFFAVVFAFAAWSSYTEAP